MAFGIRIGSEFLHIAEDATLQLEINHDIWDAADPVDIIGTFTIPITVALDPHNNRLLQYPSRLDSGYTLLADREVWLYIGGGSGAGLPYRKGNLYVRSSGRREASIMITIGSAPTLRSTKFTDLDLPVIDEGFLGKSIQDHAKDTLVSPSSWNHAFLPVYNEVYNTSPPDQTINQDEYRERFINRYDTATGKVGDTYAYNQVFTPFLKVKYLLELIASHLGIHLDDQLITGTDLELLYVYNNFNIYEIDIPDDGEDPTTYDTGWSTSIDYANHVPDLSLSEFLKAIAKTFFATITISSDRLTIQPLVDAINRSTVFDWTSVAGHDYTKRQLEDLPKQYEYEDMYKESIPMGSTYDEEVKLFWSRDRRRVYTQSFDVLETQGDDDPYVMPASPMRMFPYAPVMPRADVGGRSTFVDDNLAEDPTFTTAETSYKEIEMMIYRGRIGGLTADLPYSSNNAYDPRIDDDNDQWHSLLLTGPRSINELYAAPVIDMVNNQMAVDRQIDLDIKDILNIQPTDKVRIENLHYFVKTIRLQITQSDISPASCTLLRVNV